MGWVRYIQEFDRCREYDEICFEGFFANTSL